MYCEFCNEENIIQDNGFVRYDHEQNKTLEWVILEVLHEVVNK